MIGIRSGTLGSVESDVHRALKRLAVAFLREHGCRVVATEVRCPIARFRLDVAGYADTTGSRHEAMDVRPTTAGSRRCDPRTIIVECKASRTDFLRDARDAARLLRERDHLEALRTHLLERSLARGAPLRPGAAASLFVDVESVDESAITSPSYRAVVRRLNRLERTLYGETKFATLRRYRLADRLYICAPTGTIRPRELPTGWGLLEAGRAALAAPDPDRDLFGIPRLQVRCLAADLQSSGRHRDRILRNVAVAASTAGARAMGVLA